jgi:hypothetical protein
MKKPPEGGLLYMWGHVRSKTLFEGFYYVAGPIPVCDCKAKDRPPDVVGGRPIEKRQSFVRRS